MSSFAKCSVMTSDRSTNGISLMAYDVEAADAGPLQLEKRLMRRVDLRLLPLFGLLYAIAVMDKGNLSVAREVGMGVNLKLNTGARYSIVSCLFFVPYILLQLPSSIVLRFIRTRTWLSFLVVAWGVVQLSMGFIPTWGFLALCRVLLGGLEAGFFPALVFITSAWYTRHELQKRLSAFYVLSISIGGFGAILAYFLSLLDNRMGIVGWAWIFIIEGIFTIFLGIIAFIFVPDFPDKNNFLTSEETQFVLGRIEEDRGDSLPDELTPGLFLTHSGDWTIWVYGVMFMCSTMPAYALSFFTPSILSGMGYDVEMSLLLTAASYGPAVVSTMFFAWLADKSRKRALFIAVQALLTATGLVLMAYARQNRVRFFGAPFTIYFPIRGLTRLIRVRTSGIFLCTAGSIGCVPSVLTYSANNVRLHSKRSVSTAIIVAFGAVGGIVATTVFREQDSPCYVPGLWATLACQLLLLLLLGMMSVYFLRVNKLSREGALGRQIEGCRGFLYTL